MPTTQATKSPGIEAKIAARTNERRRHAARYLAAMAFFMSLGLLGVDLGPAWAAPALQVALLLVCAGLSLRGTR